MNALHYTAYYHNMGIEIIQLVEGADLKKKGLVFRNS